MTAALSGVATSHLVALPVKVPNAPHNAVDPDEAAEMALVQALPNPVWSGALKAHEELVQFQAECTDPELRELISEMIQLKQENQAVSEKLNLFIGLVKGKYDILLKALKYELFQLIQRSPELKKRLNNYLDNYCKEDLQIDLRDLIKQLEHGIKTTPKQEIGDGWLLVDSTQNSDSKDLKNKDTKLVSVAKESKIVSMDLEALKKLKQEVALIQSVVDGTKKSTEFFIEIKAIRSRSGLSKPDAGWETSAGSSARSLSIISSLTFAGRMAIAIAPSLKIGLALLFPTSSLTLINIMLGILSAAGSSE